jgi:hypothetical protein
MLIQREFVDATTRAGVPPTATISVNADPLPSESTKVCRSAWLDAFAGGDDGEGDVHRAVTEALVCDAFPDDRRCQKSTYRVGDGKKRDRKEQSAAEGVETAAGEE